MYGGETISFEAEYINPFYIVIGNSSSLEGMNVTFENKIITISVAQNFKSDNFTLIFMENQTMEVIKEVRVGGGGTKYIDRNVTVTQPLFFDRNITVEEIVLTPGPEVIVYEKVDTGWVKWAALTLVLILLGYSFKYVFKPKIKEEDYIQLNNMEEK